MSTNKILLAGLAGGVTAFIAGFVIYGLALMPFFEANTSEAGLKLAKVPMVWWAMVAGNIVWGMFLAYVFGKWANISTFPSGAKAGALIGFLVALSVDLMMFSTMDHSNLTATLVDPLANAALSAIVGGVVGVVLGMGGEAK
ncbi:MAG: hypothetical protein R2828_04300 [Saprospiraceae bacterium]